MSGRTRGYAHRVDIRSPPTRVWSGLTEPKLLQLWCARETRIDARAGGSHWLCTQGKFEREAHIDVFEPPRRLRLIYLPGAAMPGDDAVVVDDFLLAPQQGVTILRLLGSGIPQTPAWDPFFAQLSGGWEQSLQRLKVLLERKPGAVAVPVPVKGP